MSLTTDQALKLYTEMITRYLLLKKDGKLFPGDKEPSAEDLGLLPWAADQIKKRVEREIFRTA